MRNQPAICDAGELSLSGVESYSKNIYVCAGNREPGWLVIAIVWMKH
jgi:hypothetical protein